MNLLENKLLINYFSGHLEFKFAANLYRIRCCTHYFYADLAT